MTTAERAGGGAGGGATVAGRAHPAALGRPARAVWAEIWDQVAPEFGQVLAGGPPVHHEHRTFVIERGRGLEETVWTYTLSAVRGDDGAVLGVHGVVAETTARVQADATLRASEARFRLVADAVPQIVWITDAGGRVARRCEDDAAAGVVRVRVTDTGRGIAPERLARVFEPFVQVDRDLTHASQQGVGLGLAISRDLARGMGGDLTAESTPGAGSTFTLTLPAARHTA